MGGWTGVNCPTQNLKPKYRLSVHQFGGAGVGDEWISKFKLQFWWRWGGGLRGWLGGGYGCKPSNIKIRIPSSSWLFRDGWVVEVNCSASHSLSGHSPGTDPGFP